MTSYLKQAREWAYPTLKETAFLSRGVLTPEEFVMAGDELVFKCPTWSWEGGEKKRSRSILPPDKQYLVTRNVPCAERVAAMESAMLGETEMEIPPDDDDEDGHKEGGWLVSHVAKKDVEERVDDEFDFVTMKEDGEGGEGQPDVITSQQYKEEGGETTTATGGGEAAAPKEEEDDDDEYADFEDDNIEVDDAVATTTTTTPNTAGDKNDNIKRVRTYDISITYDKYYQTPRIFIYGYSEDGATPLSSTEMFEDVMSDYVKRTVTVESHPHVSGPHLSIHPCQHGAVMKNIVRNLMKDGDESGAPTVEMYMFIFLKFVSSIIPTMNYDFTTEVTANTEKSK